MIPSTKTLQILLSVSTARAKLRNTIRNAKALQDYLNSSPEIIETQQNNLIDELRILNTQYNIPIYIITSRSNQRKLTTKWETKDKSLTNHSNKLHSRKTGYINHIEKKYDKAKERTFAENVNTILNAKIIEINEGKSYLPHEHD